MLGAWLIADARIRNRWVDVRVNVPALAAVFAADALYLALRAQSGALSASTAPDYYQFSFTLGRLAENIPEYLDRSATFSAVILLLLLAVGRVRPGGFRPWDAHTLSTFSLGLIWWVGGFAITVFLPVRSSLYACFPSVGVVLIAASLASSAWKTVTIRRRVPIVIAGLFVPFLLWPVYHARNRRWVDAADLSSATIETLQQLATTHVSETRVLIEDNPNERPTLGAAFGSGVQLASDLMVRPALRVWLAPGPGELPVDPARPSRFDVRLALEQGRVVPRQVPDK
jgi:hypothetical protein